MFAQHKYFYSAWEAFQGSNVAGRWSLNIKTRLVIALAWGKPNVGTVSPLSIWVLV